MSSLVKSHLEKILRGDMTAAEDYGNNLICIARAGGNPETLDGAGARLLLTRLLKEVSFPDARILVNRTSDSYGVLTVQSRFAPFLSYACVTKGGKIAGTTLFIYKPARNILPEGVPMPKCQSAGKLFWKHVRAMFSIKASVITKDYAENGVVITNMAKDVCDGKPQIYAFCDHLMKNCWALIRKMDFHGITSVRLKMRSAGDGLLLFTLEAPGMNMVMTETYWVEHGKIQFECSIAHGAMLQLVHELLN